MDEIRKKLRLSAIIKNRNYEKYWHANDKVPSSLFFHLTTNDRNPTIGKKKKNK